jgi:hypothetical protein
MSNMGDEPLNPPGRVEEKYNSSPSREKQHPCGSWPGDQIGGPSSVGVLKVKSAYALPTLSTIIATNITNTKLIFA